MRSICANQASLSVRRRDKYDTAEDQVRRFGPEQSLLCLLRGRQSEHLETLT